MNKLAKFSLLPAVAVSTAATAVLSAAPAQAVSFTVKGTQCPTATCVDLGAAGYTVTGGAIVSGDIKNRALTPGTDIKLPVDPFNDSDKVTSYNVTSVIDDPIGAIDDIVVTGLNGVFELFWGSVDIYNQIEFDDGTIFTGTDIANALGVLKANAQGNYGFDAFVSFEGDFTSATLSSLDGLGTGIAFEVAAAKVPEPASLLGLAAVGLISGGSLLGRKKQQA